MAIQYVCDGCGAPVLADEMQEFGLVIKAQYCQVCSGFVDTLSFAIDEWHSKLAEKWTKERNRLRNACRKALGPNARLPDE